MKDDLTLCSLLYISQATLVAGEERAVVERMVEAAMVRNHSMGLTGALLFTGRHFAQYLEGPAHNIDLMLTDLRRDPRHDNMQVITRAVIAERRFRSWGMAYHGPSHFVSRHVTKLLNNTLPAARLQAAEWLTELLYEFLKD